MVTVPTALQLPPVKRAAFEHQTMHECDAIQETPQNFLIQKLAIVLLF